MRTLATRWGFPVLHTAMGRGILPDSHPQCVNAARSLALEGADVALVVGARLNWQLHFGEAPRWSQYVRFILVDVEPSERDQGRAAVSELGAGFVHSRTINSENEYDIGYQHCIQDRCLPSCLPLPFSLFPSSACLRQICVL